MKKAFQGIGIVVVLWLTARFVAAVFQHPPQTSQDWASWVQAIGSIAAIIAAIAVANHQARAQRAEAARLDDIKATVAATAVLMALSNAIEYLDSLIDWCMGVEDVDPNPQTVEALMKELRALPFDPPREMLLDLASLPNDCASRLAGGLGQLRIAQATLPKMYLTFNTPGEAGREKRREYANSLVYILSFCRNSFTCALQECHKVAGEYAIDKFAVDRKDGGHGVSL
jgi:hypothetical protein